MAPPNKLRATMIGLDLNAGRIRHHGHLLRNRAFAAGIAAGRLGDHHQRSRLYTVIRNRENAGEIRHRLVRGSAAAGRSGRLHRTTATLAGPDRNGRSADAPPEFPAVSRTSRRR